jgi:hypothetical protein
MLFEVGSIVSLPSAQMKRASACARILLPQSWTMNS